MRTVPIISRTNHGLFASDPEDMGVGKILRETGTYGDAELQRVFRHIGRNQNVLVAGAHIGSLTIPIARMAGEVVAIEANPRTFGLLQLNISLNEIANVHAHNIAASDKSEEIEFVANRDNSGGSKRMPKVRAFEYFYDSPEIIQVTAHALDEFLGGKEFALVFMDIEGSEYFALKGMQNILRKARTLFVEYLPHHLRNVSGVSPDEFLGLIAPHFETLEIPSKDRIVPKADFLTALQTMFDNNEGDEGLIFAK